MQDVYEDDVLIHYGTKYHSGRYPYGSGENPFQHDGGFFKTYNDLRASGLSEKEVADGFGLTVEELRKRYSTVSNPKEWIDTVKELRKKYGNNNTKIAKAMGLSSNVWREMNSNASQAMKYKNRETAIKLLEKYKGNVSAVAREMGTNESSVRSLLYHYNTKKEQTTNEILKTLRDNVKSKHYIDVSENVEKEFPGWSRTQFDAAIRRLVDDEGYVLKTVKYDQMFSRNKTTVKVLCPPGTDNSFYREHRFDVKSITDYDNGETITSLGLPKELNYVSPSRIQINYAEEGGKAKDGLIELRRGVDELSLNKANYAQVRIAVDGDYFLKGMAVYADDLPDGVDIRYNTNKSIGTPPEKVFKPMKTVEVKDANGNVIEEKLDKENPFGATIKDEEKLKYTQRYYIDKDGNKKLSAINVVAEEGNWDEWKKTISPQVLSKQTVDLAKKQIKISIAEKKLEFDEIMSVTNPAVKKKLLLDFSEDCDSAAVELKAAAFPNQRSQVILPLTTIGENEIYAPNYKQNETVALIRYPHGGKFEIPVLKVNNKNEEGIRMMTEHAMDAVGINQKTAGRLSGADFDGDTVLVIPIRNARGDKILKLDYIDPKTSKSLMELQSFDPEIYKIERKKEDKLSDAQIKRMESNKQKQMGVITNLINDMTIKGAPLEHVVRAVKHSMVVIDYVKHDYDYKASARDNNIDELMRLYQDKGNGKYGGASTIVSKAGSEVRIEGIRTGSYIDKNTGELVWKKPRYETYVDKNGKVKKATTESTQMAETKDARTLMSKDPTPMEELYADYANSLKAMANRARKEYVSTKSIERNPSAAKTYEKEVEELEAKLRLSELNSPRERAAQVLANKVVDERKRNNPYLKEDREALKKIKTQAMAAARARMGANKQSVMIDITDKEWEAIQAGAISTTKLTKIINNSNPDKIRQLATPRKEKNVLSAAQRNLIVALKNSSSAYTNAALAERFGVSPSTISTILKEA